MRTLSLLLNLSLISVLSGCRLGPKYSRPAVDAPGSYRAQAPAMDSALSTSPDGFVSTSPSAQSLGDAKWWTVFKDE
jgi:uncharacterized lipoprotein